MYVGYFDRSFGNDERPLTIVAGLVAAEDDWRRFEQRWSEALADASVPYFHMKEFAHSTGPFDEWRDNETRRRTLLQELAAIVSETVAHGVSVGVLRDDFAKAKARFEPHVLLHNEFVFAALACSRLVNQWLLFKGYGEGRWNEIMRYVFDRGDSGRDQVEHLFETEGLPKPIFAASRDDTASGEVACLPLQAADFAAYEFMRMHDQRFWPVGRMPTIRKSGELIYGTVGWADHVLSEIVVTHICEKRGIAPLTFNDY